ncbi:UBA-like protein [Pseudocohnilembus persalinus]|uniref:UBA-like protein n=1 Tax=Pseudocohnilembus persalinus TaxID=266149 RepID=A0A0V0QXU0_PSEPJ|nr:UBA-like protein [Pseudocohnilembus persalinus]|eukprot:KRX06977.1 UBA-like protein [Pseudocohnilembus persalinus]
MEQELPNVVKQLIEMGFPQEQSLYAYNHASQKEDIANVIEYLQNNEKQIQEALKSQPQTQKNEQQQQNQNQEKKEDQQQQQENKMEEEKSEEKQEEENLKPISDMVDQTMAQQLQEMGHTKIVAEKALFMTQNKKSVQAALDWIEEHKEDEDFNEELFIAGGIKKSNLTPEEARIRAKEMQAELRKKREEQEEKDEFEREKRRREMGKNMQDQAQLLKEAQRKREVEQQVKERKKFEEEKKRMEEQLDRDYIERFGMEKFKKWKADKIGKEKEKTQLQKVEDCIKSTVTAHPQKIFPDKAMTTLKTIGLYIGNIIKNPDEEKFRKINTGNNAFQKRVADSFGGQATLENCGFQLNSEGFLVLQNPDIQFLKDVQGLLEKHQKTI